MSGRMIGQAQRHRPGGIPAAWADRALAARARPSDPAADFCLWPYDRPAAPVPGALRSEALLWAALGQAGFGEDMAALLHAVRTRWGRFRTVWGVKWDGAALSVELYFYDYARERRRLGLSDLIATLSPWLACDIRPDDRLRYFMASVEVGPDTLADGRLRQIDVYMGNPGSSVSSGLCYGLSAQGMEFRNAYYFFDARREATAALAKLAESVHLPAAGDPGAMVWPGLGAMQTLVVANKRWTDALYYSRISVDDLAVCLDRLGFPAPLQEFLHAHRDGLAHHLYDVGWDFAADPDGHPQPAKGSFYGLL